MYTGKNRNMSTITKGAVEKALPTLANIPIVGEFSVDKNDFKGHGGKIDVNNDYRYIHTTKPYGVVPESATTQWVQVQGADGQTREYLEIDGCYLWTGRYEEAESIVQNGKSQSMEIEVTDGSWDSYEESYMINDFIFSALCILGDDTEPAFEDAKITAYSLDKDVFKQEFTEMMDELKFSLSQNKEVKHMDKLKQLLKQYSVSMKEVTASGIVFANLSEEQLEAKFVEVFGNKGAKNKNQNQVASGLDSDNSENAPKGTVTKDPDEQYGKMMGKGNKSPQNDEQDVKDPQDPKDGAKEDDEDKKFDLTPEQVTAMAQKSASVAKPAKDAVGNPDNLELEPVIQDKNNDNPSSLKGKVEELQQGDASFDAKDVEDADVKFNEDPTQVEPVLQPKKNHDDKDSLKGDYIEIEKDASFADKDPDNDGDDDSSAKGDNDADAKDLKKKYDLLLAEVESLREFKLQIEKADKEDKAEKLFKDFQLNESDIEGLDIHAFSLEEIEEKCYALLGRKIASKKNFSKDETKGIHLPLHNGNENKDERVASRYGNLFSKNK